MRLIFAPFQANADFLGCNHLWNLRNLRFKFSLLLSGPTKAGAFVYEGLEHFNSARIPKGTRKALPRFSSAPNAIRIKRLEPVVLIWRFTTDCFSASGRPE